jgi:VWFA-related protein
MGFLWAFALLLLCTASSPAQFRRLPAPEPAKTPASESPAPPGPVPAKKPSGWGTVSGNAEAAPPATGTLPSTTNPEPPAPSAEEDFVIRQDVRLVRVDVQVAEKDRVIQGLSRSDFTLLDNGVPTPITDFGTESDPVDLMMLLDVSGSMTSYLYEVSRAAGLALQQLTPEDRVGVMIFSKNGKLLNELTASRPDVLTTLRSLTRLPDMAAGTAINMSIMDAIAAFRTDAAAGKYDPRHRRAILILTDNWGLNYKMPDRTVLRNLHEENISLHAIVVGRVQKPKGKWGAEDDDVAEQLDFSPANVFRLADDTGGDIFTDLKKDSGLAEILGRIRTRYSLYFKPPANATAGSYRQIQVNLAGEALKANRKAAVRARAGYFTR